MAKQINLFIFSSNFLGGAEIAMSKVGEKFQSDVLFIVPKKDTLNYKLFKKKGITVASYYEFFKIHFTFRARYKLLSFGTKAFLIATAIKIINRDCLNIVNIRGADINRTKFKSMIFKLLNGKIDLFISNSYMSINEWRLRGEVKNQKTKVIRNIPPDNISKTYFNKNKPHNTIGVIANLKFGKGYDHLQKLINSDLLKHKITFKIFGRAVDFKFDDLEFHNPNIQVEYQGFENNPNKIYKNLDLILLISDSEGLPNSFIEAISAGIPVISTDIGGTTEIIQDKINGLLFLEKNITSCADNLNLFYSSSELRETLRNSAILHEDFDKQTIVKHWHEILKD